MTLIMVSWMDEETELVTKARYVRANEFGDAELELEIKDIKEVEKVMIKLLGKIEDKPL